MTGAMRERRERGADPTISQTATRTARAMHGAVAREWSFARVPPRVSDQAGGGAPAAPAAPPPPAAPAASLAGLRAVRTNFRNGNGDAVDPDNCAPLAATLGSLGLGTPTAAGAHHMMEMTYRLDGPIPPGTEFDITRTKNRVTWSRAGGAWTRHAAVPAGSADDSHDADECLVPNARRIFVLDRPGFNALAGFDAAVYKSNFFEWVIARNRPLGIAWTPISRPTFTRWHAVISAENVAGTWTLVNTPGGDTNEITRGHINLAGATP